MKRAMAGRKPPAAIPLPTTSRNTGRVQLSEAAPYPRPNRKKPLGVTSLGEPSRPAIRWKKLAYMLRPQGLGVRDGDVPVDLFAVPVEDYRGLQCVHVESLGDIGAVDDCWQRLLHPGLGVERFDGLLCLIRVYGYHQHL